MFTDDKAELPAPWQWPGLWSLNLPVLVLLWQMLFAQSFHVWMGLHHFAAVAALSWTFLAVERWIFFFRLRARQPGEEESAEWIEQRSSMARICVLIVIGLVLTAVFRANIREMGGMMIWTSLGGAYLLGLRFKPAQVSEALPREMALAIYLAGIALLFIWANSAFGPGEMLLPALLFVLLLFYYLSLVTGWAAPLMPFGAPLFEGPSGSIFRIAPLLLIFGGALLALVSPAVTADQLLVTMAVSGFLLLMLDLSRSFLSKPALRLLADLTLLTPIAPLLVGL